MLPLTILLINLAATWFMCGLIWFVQVVHYPAFCGVGADGFMRYHDRHTRATTAVVVAPMLLELGSAMALVIVRPEWFPPLAAWLGLALVALIWASTFLLQVPAHHRLALGYDDAAHKRLCRSNWVRTTAWTVRAVGLLALTAVAMRS